MSRLISLMAIVVAGGCGTHGTSLESGLPPEAPDHSASHAIADVDDLCLYFPPCDLTEIESIEDFDGCPEVAIGFAAQEAAPGERARTLIVQLAEELDRRDEIVQVTVQGGISSEESPGLGLQRAEAVAGLLVQRGVARSRLKVADLGIVLQSAGEVTFEILCVGAGQ